MGFGIVREAFGIVPRGLGIAREGLRGVREGFGMIRRAFGIVREGLGIGPRGVWGLPRGERVADVGGYRLPALPIRAKGTLNIHGTTKERIIKVKVNRDKNNDCVERCRGEAGKGLKIKRFENQGHPIRSISRLLMTP